MEPEERPTFKKLCQTISTSIELIAGYLQIGFNPFSAEREGEGEGGGIDSSVSVHIVPPSVDATAHDIFSSTD